MIEQGLFKRYFVGRDGFIWWVGQIAPESTWSGNKPSGPVGNNNDFPGFGERYRVRIMGYHTADTDALPDDELPWAYIMYPVTAGTGSRGSSASANITQGDFVFGFFMDGEDAQMPVIMGLLGNNEYAAVQKNITKARFIPFSGFTEKDQLSRYSVKVDRGDTVVPQSGAQTTEGTTVAQGDQAESPNNSVSDESATQSTTTVDSASEASAQEQTQPLAQPADCEPVPIGKIQQDIKNTIVDIQKAQKAMLDYQIAVTINGKEYTAADGQEYIQKKIDFMTEKTAEGIKWVFKETEKFVTQKVNNLMKDTYFLVFPNERPQLKNAVSDVNDLMACLFRKFVKGLIGQVGGMLKDAANKIINAAQCVVENLVANTIGALIGEISAGINSILGGISSLTGQITSLAGDVLGIITDVLSFLSCEEKPVCPGVNNWNILGGPAPLSKGDISNLASKAKNIASTATGIVDSAAGIVDGVGNLASLDITNALNLDGCGIGPVLCGPPLAQFWSGPKSAGAAANLIISTAGEVIGVDLISFGAGYKPGQTWGNVDDQCGNGHGAVIQPVVGNYFTDATDDDGNPIFDSQGNPVQVEVENGIIDVDIIEPGSGYLPAPNGSQGGNNYTWADPEDTIIQHPDGSYETPTPPGNVVVVNPGDEVQTPPGTVIVTEPQPGGEEGVEGGGQGGGEEIIGGVPITVTSPGVFTTPEPDLQSIAAQYPIVSSGSYPVILYLCDIKILDSGFNYSEGDQIIIEPDIGAKAEPKFDAQGRLISVKVTEGAEGFTEFPTVYIRSNSGYNAELRPKLCIDRVGSDELREPMVQDKVVSVIDCVGKF